MKEVRAQMEKQGAQVKKLEANHAHLIDRNQFRVLIFQEQTEIPSSVFVKDQPPFPRDDIMEEGEEPEAEGSGLHTIDLSSDEEAGLEAEPEDDWLLDPEVLEAMEPTRAEKLKRSSLKKVDSLKKAFSKQNIEKKMTKIGTKLVSVEQRQKMKMMSPISFSLKKPHGAAAEEEHVLEAVAEARDSPDAVAHEEEQEKVQGEQEKVQAEQEVQEEFQEMQEKVQEEQEEELEEGLSPDYALSSTLPQTWTWTWRKTRRRSQRRSRRRSQSRAGLRQGRSKTHVRATGNKHVLAVAARSVGETHRGQRPH
uniref:Serum deprivation-response protein n=1 Tax=Neogobius melanostomus TaxID=47308 RepID=A0A8C6SMM9_9GOBI